MKFFNVVKFILKKGGSFTLLGISVCIPCLSLVFDLNLLYDWC